MISAAVERSLESWSARACRFDGQESFCRLIYDQDLSEVIDVDNPTMDAHQEMLIKSS